MTAAVPLLFALNAHIALRSTLAFAPAAHAPTAGALDRRNSQRG